MKYLFSKMYWQDKDVEVIIGKLLRYGVVLSSAIIILGGVIYLAAHGSTHPDYSQFFGEIKNLNTFSGVINGALVFHGKEIIQLGILVLIATPVARVLFSVFAFLIEKDWLYVVITLIVLVIIIFSIIVGFGG